MSIHVRSKEKEIGTTVKGSFAKIDKGVASGFSVSNYIKTQETFNPQSNAWEVVIPLTTSSDVSTLQLFGHISATYSMNFNIQNGKFALVHYQSAATGSLSLQPNTKYYVKISWDKTKYQLAYSTNGIDYITDITISSSTGVGTVSMLSFGSNGSNSYFKGMIDFEGAYAKIDDELWWSGDTYTKVGSWINDTVVSGISSANYLTIDKSFDVSKGEHWEFVVKATTATLPTDGSYQVIFRGNQTEGVGFVVQILNKHLTLHCGSALVNGQFNIAQLVQSTLTVESNTTYWFRGAFNGSQYTVDVSTDEKEWVNYITVASTASIGTTTYTLGCNSPIYTTSIFTGSIDLLGCYININGSRWWSGYDYAPVLLKDVYKSTGRKYYKYGTEPNATVVGSPNINEGVVSGFSSRNYLTLPKTFNPENNTWEAVIKFETLSNFSAQQIILHPASSSGLNVALVIDTTGKILAYAGTNGSSWNILNSTTGTTILSPLTSYYIKMQYTGTAYEVYLSTDGNTFNLELSVSSSSFVKGGFYLTLGAWASDERHVESIDLTQSYIKINDKEWWHGTKAYEVNLDGEDVYEDWTQPVLTANGTMGGDSFAVSASSYYDSGSQAWYAFDGNTTDANKWYSAVNGEKWLAFYNPIALNVTSLTVYNHIDARWYLGGGTVQASADGITWENLTTFTQSGRVDSFVIDLGFNKKSYKYYRLNNLIGIGSNGEVWIREIKITAQQLVKVGGDSYDYSEVLKKRIVAAYKTGDRKYYKYQYWKQPVLSANGTMGGDSFAVNQSSTLDGVSSSGAWKAFDNTGSVSRWHSAQNLPQWISWYNPKPLKISNVNVTNRALDGSYTNAYQLQYSDNNSTWITAVSGNGTSGDSVSWDIPVTHDTAHKYWRLYVTSASGSNNSYVAIGKIEITAKEPIESTSSDYDLSLVEVPQLVYNLKYDLINPADWQAIGTISGHNFFGAGTFSEYISATREGAVTFKTPLPSGKYTWRFLYYSQVNHTFGTYKITATYEDGTTEVVYDSGLGDTAYGGGEKATIDLSLTFKKPVKVLTNYTNSWGSGSGCYGGSGNVQLFFDGSKQ